MSVARIGMAAAAVLALATPALAQDGEPAVGWTGFYYGTHTGAVEGDFSVTDIDGGEDLPGTTFSDGQAGYASGIHGGYNHALGMLLLGVELDVDSVGYKTRILQDNTPASGFARDAEATTEIDWLASIRGRIGVTPWQHLLLYGTGGYAYADLESRSIAFTGGLPDDGLLAKSTDGSGWVAGGGAELAVTRGTTARIEYLHYDLGDTTVAAPDDFRFKFSNDLDVVRFGLSYRLGSGESPFETFLSSGGLKDGEMPVDWTGFYLGGHLGAIDSDNTHVDVDGDQDVPGTAHEYSNYGYSAGVHAGYNQDFGWIVAGIEGDVSYARMEASAVLDNTPASGGDRDALAITTLDSLASIRGRIGINPWDKVLVYGTGGYAWADLTNEIEDFDGAAFDPDDSGSVDSDSGWVAGAGLEVMLTSRLSSRTEYLHYDLGDSTLVTPNGFTHTFENELDVVRTGLNVRF